MERSEKNDVANFHIMMALLPADSHRGRSFWFMDHCIDGSGIFDGGQSALTVINFNQAALQANNFTSMHCTPSFTLFNKSLSQC